MRRRLKSAESAEVVLPAASFLDMVFQLFAFFIITYNPTSLEGQMEMALPASGMARADSAENTDPTVVSDRDAELRSELVVSVKTNQAAGNGTIGAIYVEDAAGVAQEISVDSEKDPDLNVLREYLKQSRGGLSVGDIIKIKAESTLKHAYVMRVMDACYRAGFTSIGFAPPPDQKGPN